MTDQTTSLQNTKLETLKVRKLEVAVFLLFIVAYTVIAAFHEPWFDEAQAWEIAKYSSLDEIIFTVGHYEGHPFLWYFILAIPAKLGVPFELGLKSVGWIISIASAFIVLFKSPFPKAVRCIIPFTYFFFYQYGIIVRPYGLILLLMLLCAIVFDKKDQKPWVMVLLMMLLCALSAYGALLAGSIAICWVIDILKEYGHSFSLKAVLHDKRLVPLCALLVFALFILSVLLPYSDTYSAASNATNSKIICFVTTVFTFLGDAFVTTSPFFNNDTIILQNADIEPMYVVVEGIISVVLAIAFASFSSKKKLKYFFLPYLLFTIFSSCVYFSIHHMGVLAVYILFWSWINTNDANRFETGRTLFAWIKGKEKDRKLYRGLGIGIICVCSVVNLYWSVGSSVLDVMYQYSAGRETSEFLKESGLDQLKVAGEWLELGISDGEERSVENVNTRLTGKPPLILAYYDSNFIYTFNNGENIGYTMYKSIDPEVNRETIERCQAEGTPDVLIGSADLHLLTNDQVTMDDYAPVYEMSFNYIFKANLDSSCDYVYLRRDLLEEYNLTEIEVEDGTLEITDEMKKRYENGESVDSILESFFEKQGLASD